MTTPSPREFTRAAIVCSLKEILAETGHLEISPQSICDDADIFSDYGIDSTSIVDLVLAIEERLQITIADEEIEIGIFQQVSSIADFVLSKLMQSNAGSISSEQLAHE